jgi:hypothetical protein
MISLQTQPLRSHAPNLLVKRGHFFLAPGAPRPGRVAAAYFFQYFLNGELGVFAHNRTSRQERSTTRSSVRMIALDSSLGQASHLRQSLDHLRSPSSFATAYGSRTLAARHSDGATASKRRPQPGPRGRLDANYSPSSGPGCPTLSRRPRGNATAVGQCRGIARAARHPTQSLRCSSARAVAGFHPRRSGIACAPMVTCVRAQPHFRALLYVRQKCALYIAETVSGNSPRHIRESPEVGGDGKRLSWINSKRRSA